MNGYEDEKIVDMGFFSSRKKGQYSLSHDDAGEREEEDTE